jgi:FkbH-like protein
LIVVAATFVAEPLEQPLAWLLEVLGLKEEIRFAPYHQVFQQLLTPTSEVALNIGGISVVLVRIEDYVRELADPTVARQTVERVTKDLGDALEKVSNGAKGTVAVAILPPGPRAHPDLTEALVVAGDLLARRARGLPGIQLFENDLIEAVASGDRYDEARDELAHIPYTEAHFAALALAIARRIHAIRVPAAKVLVLDCDNTLWHGVVGEDGVEGIKLSEPYLAVQDFAVAKQAQGILVCLASKNVEGDVLEVLNTRKDMHLNQGHLVAHRINWLPKPANIRSLAAELNLGLDAFVFVDDNPVECAQVRAELPEVVTIQLPVEPDIQDFLRRLWVFDKLTTTAEDAARTRMYQANSARRAMESAAGDIGEFLAALDLKIDIAAPSEGEWLRLEQLTQRTNQFNFMTRRRTAVELQSSLASGAHVLRVRVSDRFGDYGLVGAIVAQEVDTTLQVDNLMLSCRVLGRGVEHAMLRRLGGLARASQLQDVSLPYIATARNVPARAFADSVAAEFAELHPAGTVYRIPVARAESIEHKPGHDPTEVISARIADEKKTASTEMAAGRGRSERYSRLAHLLISGHAVLEQMAGSSPRSRSLAEKVSAPASPIEAELLQIWENVLKMEGLGVEDDFFALGGTSLLSVQLFVEIARRFGVQLRLTTILDSPTVRSLARLVSPATATERSSVVCLRRGGARNLFLVHDGLGETLLYLNLARRLASTLTVYGIEPRRLPGIPLAHASIEDMAAFYVDQIQGIQPHGPYLLGGMCAGGVIAYEMAAFLKRAGESIQMVAILDGATPRAAKRVGRVTRARLSRLEGTLAQLRATNAAGLLQMISIAGAIARKACNLVVYEASSVVKRFSVRLRLALLKFLVKRGAPWPKALPELSVMQIYNALESQYIPPALADVPILLVRATAGVGANTPYREVYRDADFGWRTVADQLELVDVEGGHSSMLQEHVIDSLATAMLERFTVDGMVHTASAAKAPTIIRERTNVR